MVVASFGALRLSLITSGGLSLSRFGLNASFAFSGRFALSARFAAVSRFAAASSFVVMTVPPSVVTGMGFTFSLSLLIAVLTTCGFATLRMRNVMAPTLSFQWF